MPRIKPLSLTCQASYLLALVLLAACATQTQPDVGAVVVAPRAQIPPVPVIVQTTLPKPTGYFQNSFLNYFSVESGKPTK